IQIVEAIADTLNITDTIDYLNQLKALDKDFSTLAREITHPLIFGDRFPFQYFAQAYGLQHFSAFPGCADQTEASPATIAALIEKVKQDGISTVFYIEFSSHQIADVIAEATGCKTAMLHSCHNVSAADLRTGATYLSLMEQNLNTLYEAFANEN
ncbi:MAG: metal ABC transporter substrate-binding protein, partial [Clostridia bacterium]|nr:metal ABC transporter substrate-binding protein [Clostridia bacterium]